MYRFTPIVALLFTAPVTTADDLLSVDHDAPLLASDLDFEKWTITAKIDSDTVLTLVHVLRFRGDNQQVRAFETVKYSNDKGTLTADMLVGNPKLFHRTDEIAVRAPNGSVNTYDVRQEDQAGTSTVVKNSRFKANGKLQFVGSHTYSAGDSETLKIVLFAKVAKLSDYPKLTATVGEQQAVDIQQSRQMKVLPPEIKKHLP